MGRPSQLDNPIALSAMSVVPIVRGTGYLIADLKPSWTISMANVGPDIPYLPLWLVGSAWVALGVFLVSTLWVWRWFRTAAALAVGAYITWAIIYVVDLFLSPDIVSITSLAGYIAMVPIIITLVGFEMDRYSVRDMDPAAQDRAINRVPPLDRE